MFVTNNTFCFTCGERKIWSNIKKSQNIMSMIVAKPTFLNDFSKTSKAELYATAMGMDKGVAKTLGNI